MGIRVWASGILLLLLWGRVTCHTRSSFCPRESLIGSIFRFRELNCPVYGDSRSFGFNGVIEGNEASLEEALSMVNKNSYDYVAVLFYASWCPFSRMFRPTFSNLSSLYPHIPHLAIEESTIFPRLLSKYGVHGFPTVFIINSTMRVRYHGSRTPSSLIAFYSGVTGISLESLDQISLDKIESPSTHEKHDSTGWESFPLSWAMSTENLFRQERYLVLATAFVLLRLLYFIFPTLLAFAQGAWRRFIQNIRLGGLLEHPLAYLHRAVQLLNSLKEPCKRSNLQGGARNATVWASKSLATVSIGKASTSLSNS